MNVQFSKKDTNIVKGVAILAMLFHHSYVTNVKFKVHGVSFAPLSRDTVITLAYWSKVCVGIFVFLSAYGIALSLKKLYEQKQYNRQNISLVTMRRVWRILSGFWPIFLLAVLGCALWAPDSFQVYQGGMAKLLYMFIDFVGLAHFFDTPTLMGTWWYLSLAFMEVILLPILYYLYRRYGAFIMISLSYFLPVALSLEMSSLMRYLPAMLMGIWFAEENLFVKVADYKLPHTGWAGTRVLELVMLTVVLLGTVWLKTSAFGKEYKNITDSITPLAVILFTWLFLSGIPVLRDMLSLCGKYSMNIFLLHNFIRTRWFEDFSYSFTFWWLIVLVLLLDNLFLSILIEKIKEILPYNRWAANVEKQLHKLVKTNEQGR